MTSKTKAKKLRPLDPKNALARRVCSWINTVHGGNVSEASRDLGCSYDMLVRQAAGSAKKPVLDVVQKLAMKTGQSVDWWLTGRSIAR